MKTVDAPALPVNVGDVLGGKYRVLRVLGRGGMGYVVAARHEQIGHTVAIKLLLPSVSAHKDYVERFLREAKAAVQLRSEHSTRVLDVDTVDIPGAPPVPYLVMEHLEGRSLADALRAGALPVREAALYVSHACEALEEAHGLGIVHRDLKPDNLFLTRDAKGAPLVKILDFGISKVPVTGPGDARLTGVADIMGTPLYMSPEQMQSARSADPRSDIWALGVTLFELLTCAMPFPGDTVTEICTRVLSASPPRPSELRPAIPTGLDAVVLRCLQKDPASRFQSARELTAALAPFILPATPFDNTILAVPTPRATGGTSTGAGAGTAAPWVTATGTAAPRSRRRALLIAGAAVSALAGAVLIGALLFGSSSRSLASLPISAAALPPAQTPPLTPTAAPSSSSEPPAAASVTAANSPPPLPSGASSARTQSATTGSQAASSSGAPRAAGASGSGGKSSTFTPIRR